MIAAAKYVLAALVIAGAVHLFAVHAAPRVLMGAAIERLSNGRFNAWRVAERVTVRQPSIVGVLLANRVEGSVRPILDWRGALVAGTAFAIVARLLRRR